MGIHSSPSQQPYRTKTSVLQRLFLFLILFVWKIAVLLFGSTTFEILPTN